MRPGPGRSSSWATPLAGVVSGLLFALSFPPVGWAILLPLALAPWLVALRSERRGRALWSSSSSGSPTGAPRFRGSSRRYALRRPEPGPGRHQSRDPGGDPGRVARAWRGRPFARLRPGRVAPRGVPAPLDGVRARALLRLQGIPWNLTAHALYRHPIWLQTRRSRRVRRRGPRDGVPTALLRLRRRARIGARGGRGRQRPAARVRRRPHARRRRIRGLAARAADSRSRRRAAARRRSSSCSPT